MQKNIPEKVTGADEIVKCEELWYEDGNLVIQIKSTLFKVHRSILCQNSSVFADAFALPTSIQSESYFEGSPVVQFYDDVAEMTYFLQAIYKSSVFSTLLGSAASKPTFEQVIAFARLGTKYNVPHIRRFALRLLRLNLPLSVEEIHLKLPEEHWTFSTGSNIVTMATKVIELARQLDLPDLLPAAFTMASCIKTKFLLMPYISNLLTEEDRSSCLEGHEELLVLQSVVVAYFATATCPNELSVCVDASKNLLKTLLSYDHGPTYTPFTSYFLPKLCKACNSSVEEKVMEIRRVFWDKIPAIFKLPIWDVLRAKRGEEDEGATAKTNSEASSASMPETTQHV